MKIARLAVSLTLFAAIAACGINIDLTSLVPKTPETVKDTLGPNDLMVVLGLYDEEQSILLGQSDSNAVGLCVTGGKLFRLTISSSNPVIRRDSIAIGRTSLLDSHCEEEYPGTLGMFAAERFTGVALGSTIEKLSFADTTGANRGTAGFNVKVHETP